SGSILSDPSNQASATLVPSAPGGLTAAAASASRINLAWSDVTGETGFKIERSPDGASWTQVGTTAAGVTTYQDTSLAAATTYYYRMRAGTSAGNSAPSNVASAATSALNVPAAPSGLTAAVSGSQINLTWTDVAGEAGFKIERSADGVTFTQVAT